MEVLIKPHITEKTSNLSENNKYVFLVDKRSNKIQIKKAVEKMYGVNVEEVNTANYLGKNKTRYTKKGVISGRRNSYKKATVKVSEGDIIDFYSNI